MPEGKTSTTAKQTRIFKGVTITSVTSTSRIKTIAADQGINPQEVFVHVGFKVGEKELEGSNQLRFLGKLGYQRLQECREKGTPVDVSLSYNPEFESCLLYIENDNSTDIDELFATPVENKRRADTLAMFNTK